MTRQRAAKDAADFRGCVNKVSGSATGHPTSAHSRLIARR